MPSVGSSSNEQLRLGDQRPRERELLLLAAAQVASPTLVERRQNREFLYRSAGMSGLLRFAESRFASRPMRKFSYTDN